ncbi:MAG: helix-turn-helix domain-containing protein [Steroidobacteraceae bacterium]
MGKYDRLIRRVLGSVDYWAQAAMRRFVLDLDRRMRAQSMSRVMLAERLETTPAYVTKVMRGDVNFTLQTMTKLALAVGGKLNVEIVDRDAKWRDLEWHSEHARCGYAVSRTTVLEFEHNIANQPHYEYEKVVGIAA